jgi:arginyl-tRNA synthetase
LKSLLEQLLVAAIRTLVGTLLPQMPDAAAITVERTRDWAHGDFASNIAMRLAKAAGRDPREVAEAIIVALPASPLVAKAAVAGNGFINFSLVPAALAREIRRIHELGDTYGQPGGSPGSPWSPSASEAVAPAFRALRDELGEDAYRFFSLMRGDVDLKLARKRTIDNPLYAVQYAHARVASVMKEMKARSISFDRAAGLDNLERLDKETERVLIAMLLRFPEEVESASANCAPHSIVYYLRDVANAFHTYYNAEKWLVEEVDLRNARLGLVLAAGQVLRNGLALIGVSAPESM